MVKTDESRGTSSGPVVKNPSSPGSIPGQGTRFHMPQLRPGTAKKKKKKNGESELKVYECLILLTFLYEILAYQAQVFLFIGNNTHKVKLQIIVHIHISIKP